MDYRARFARMCAGARRYARAVPLPAIERPEDLARLRRETAPWRGGLDVIAARHGFDGEPRAEASGRQPVFVYPDAVVKLYPPGVALERGGGGCAGSRGRARDLVDSQNDRVGGEVTGPAVTPVPVSRSNTSMRCTRSSASRDAINSMKSALHQSFRASLRMNAEWGSSVMDACSSSPFTSLPGC